MPAEPTLLLTCEHGGTEIPPSAGVTFPPDLLASHRGWDPGALDVARAMAESLGAPLLYETVTRLLVDLNRSPDAPDLHHASVPAAARASVLRDVYQPYRDAVLRRVEGTPRTLHVGVHSFVDVLGDSVRDVDVGLLFDPARPAEAAVCERWRRELEAVAPHLRTRFNAPYLGTDDGLTTHLRTRFADDRYAGVEVELRQGLLASDGKAVAAMLADTLRAAMAT